MTTPFRVIVADPAWQFQDKLPGNGRGADKHYSTLSIDDLCLLELPPIADDALLFMWRVASMQTEALNLMHMWGFDQKSEMVWIKTRKGVAIAEDETELAFGMGRYTRHAHEVCLIGTRGKAATQVMKDHSVRSVFFAEREEHSKKPDKFFELVEKMTGGEGPYLELFARQPRDGWVSIGDELGTKLKKIGEDGNGSQDASADANGGSSAGSGAGDAPNQAREKRGAKGKAPRTEGDAPKAG